MTSPSQTSTDVGSTPPTGLAGRAGLASQLQDLDPEETLEWVESLDQVIDHAGRNRAL